MNQYHAFYNGVEFNVEAATIREAADQVADQILATVSKWNRPTEGYGRPVKPVRLSGLPDDAESPGWFGIGGNYPFGLKEYQFFIFGELPDVPVLVGGPWMDQISRRVEPLEATGHCVRCFGLLRQAVAGLPPGFYTVGFDNGQWEAHGLSAYNLSGQLVARMWHNPRTGHAWIK